jgi:hypothetical protein
MKWMIAVELVPALAWSHKAALIASPPDRPQFTW